MKEFTLFCSSMFSLMTTQISLPWINNADGEHGVFPS